MNKDTQFTEFLRKKHPVLWLLGFVLLIFAAITAVAPLLAIVVLMPFYGFDVGFLMKVLQNPVNYPDDRMVLLFFQGFTSFIGFIVTPFLYLRASFRKFSLFFFDKGHLSVYSVLLVALITITFIVGNAFFIEWNSNISFPSSMKGLEEGFKAMEDKAQALTSLLTQSDTYFEFLVALIVISVIPAIGEELVFRGVIQNYLSAFTKNIHVAVWVTGILFGIVHFQFYGLVPRIFLGVLFGYLYYWSGNLAIPIIAHFINNAFTLILLTFYSKGLTSIDVEHENVPWGYSLAAFIVSGALVGLFVKYTKSRKYLER